MVENKAKKKMTKQELEEWDNLYQYVRKEIMLYDENQKLNNNIILSLQGLRNGKAMNNNGIKDMAKYTDKIILLTFMMCRPKIFTALFGKDFKDDFAKFRYVKAIVESNINFVYERLKQTEKTEEKLENTDTNILKHNAAEYKTKENKEVKNKKLKDLW